jgi:zinc transport system substrate-binding protein
MQRKMIMRRLFALTLCMLIVFGLFAAQGCTRKSERSPDSGKPIIAVSIVPERTFVEAVCGDLAEVITMVPPGNSPENYEPAPELMEKFSDAELYFSIGVPTEQANILPNKGDVTVIPLHEEVAAVYPERTFESGERDPHIWLSPKRAKVMIDVIEREMSKLDPQNADTYRQNADAYIKELDELDGQITDTLSGIEVRKFVVYHPAFGYFADDYGLEMFALEEEGKEATPQHLQNMIDIAKEENIKVIFYQEEIDSSQSKAFAEELGGITVKLAPLAADYIDNLRKMAGSIAEGMQ